MLHGRTITDGSRLSGLAREQAEIKSVQQRVSKCQIQGDPRGSLQVSSPVMASGLHAIIQRVITRIAFVYAIKSAPSSTGLRMRILK
jgi:hypothetical protein